MAYTKTVWVNDMVPDIDADNLNKIEQGIYDLDQHSTDLDGDVEDLDNRLINLKRQVDNYDPMPAGGSNGQVLTKSADGPIWSDAGTPTYEETKAAIEEWLEDHPSAVSGFMASNVYPVGPLCKYETIEDAYDAAVENHGGTILIYPGVYDEAITMAEGSDGYDIKFIGISKEKCIWKSSTFGYANACFTGTGNLTFENLTMQKGNEGDEVESQGGYALHLDYPNMTGKMHITNCVLISYENAALGCGTRTNQEIYVKGCMIVSYIGPTISTNGALLYHTAPESGHTGQKFSLIDNIIIGAHSGKSALNVYNSGNNTEDTEPVFIDNTVWSGIFSDNPSKVNYWEAVVSTSLVTANSTMTLTIDNCHGNNHDAINAISESSVRQQTKLVNGIGAAVTDTANPPYTNGFIVINAGATDTPNSARSYYGIVMSYSTTSHTYLVFDANSNNGNSYTKTVRNGVTTVNWTLVPVYGKSLWGRTSNPMFYSKYGNIVTINWMGSANAVGNYTVSYPPLYAQYIPGIIRNGNSITACRVSISTTGVISVLMDQGATPTSNDILYFNAAYSMD